MLKQTKTVLEYQLPIKIEPQSKGGFVVSCPSWKDCYAQGESVDEAILEVTGVAQSLIELYREEGLEIPLKIKKEESVDNLLSLPVIMAA